VSRSFSKGDTKTACLVPSKMATFLSLTPLPSCLGSKDLAEDTRVAQGFTKDERMGGLE
jgi:hypothetical protein